MGIFSYPKCPDLSGAHTDSFQGHEVITHLHIVSRLRLSGTIPLLPLFAYMAWVRQLNLMANGVPPRA